MVARRRGRIVNVASGAGTYAIPFLSAYVVSKTALIRLTENLAAEAHDHGVRVFAMEPGTVRTAMTDTLTPAHRRLQFALGSSAIPS